MHGARPASQRRAFTSKPLHPGGCRRAGRHPIPSFEPATQRPSFTCVLLAESPPGSGSPATGPSIIVGALRSSPHPHRAALPAAGCCLRAIPFVRRPSVHVLCMRSFPRPTAALPLRSHVWTHMISVGIATASRVRVMRATDGSGLATVFSCDERRRIGDYGRASSCQKRTAAGRDQRARSGSGMAAHPVQAN